MRLESFGPEDIVIPDRLRKSLNETAVQGLMESIQKIGLQSPPTVRWAGDDVVLVAGRHRLEALRRLGVPLVQFKIFKGDERDARLWEIAENLHRAELSEAERRQHIAEWVELTAEKVVHGGQPSTGGAQPLEAGISKAARELGFNRQTVVRAVHAERLAPEAKQKADELGFGTVVRATAAAAPTPAAQVAHIEAEARKRQEAALAREEERRRLREQEDAHKLNKQQDVAIRLTVEQEFAEWLLRHTAASEIDTLISWLQVVKSAGVIAALRREAA